MDYYERFKRKSKIDSYKAFGISFIGIVLCILFCLLTSCSAIKYVPVETIKTDTVYKSKIQRDSIHVHDSVTIREKGDTVMIEHWQTRWRDRLLTDTVYSTKTEVVQVPYPVEKPLTKWQQICIDYGKLTMGATILLVIFVIVWIARKLKKV